MDVNSTSDPGTSQKSRQPGEHWLSWRSWRFWLIMLLLVIIELLSSTLLGHHQFLFAGLILLFISLMPVIFSLRATISWEQQRRLVAFEKKLKRSGIFAIGQVEERRIVGSESNYRYNKNFFGRSPYVVIYSYECEGNRYQGSQEVYQEVFPIWKKGDPALVRYDPDDPQKAMVENVPHVYPTAHVKMNIVCFAMIAAFFLAFCSISVFIIFFPSK